MRGATLLAAVHALETEHGRTPSIAAIVARLVELEELPPAADGRTLNRGDLLPGCVDIGLLVRGDGKPATFGLTTKGRVALAAYKRATELGRPLARYFTDPRVMNALTRRAVTP